MRTVTHWYNSDTELPKEGVPIMVAYRPGLRAREAFLIMPRIKSTTIKFSSEKSWLFSDRTKTSMPVAGTVWCHLLLAPVRTDEVTADDQA